VSASSAITGGRGAIGQGGDRPSARAAMERLGFLLGRWRGPGWIIVGERTVEFEQEELVRAVLGGELITVEGRASDPGNREDVRFNAFAIARYDTDARAYSWRAYTAGHCGEVPLYVGAGTYRWEYEPTPNVLVRFEATVGAGRWHQTGHTRVGGRWTQTFEMNLTAVPGND
jgi:hypothetical protein